MGSTGEPETAPEGNWPVAVRGFLLHREPRLTSALKCPCKNGASPYLSDVLDSYAAAYLETASSGVDGLQESGIVLQPVVEPVVLCLEADEKAGHAL